MPCILGNSGAYLASLSAIQSERGSEGDPLADWSLVRSLFEETCLLSDEPYYREATLMHT